MFNNMENRDLYFDNDENKKKKRGIWIILIYIFFLLFLLLAVFYTSSNFLNSTIKENEIIIEEPDDDDYEDDKQDDYYDDNDSTYDDGKYDDDSEQAKLKITFIEQEDTKIRLRSAYPISEKKALEEDSLIQFTMENLSEEAYYKISLKDIIDKELEEKYENRRIDHKYLNYYLKNLNTNQEYKGNLSNLDKNNQYICSGIINKNETINFYISVWIDKSAGNDVQNSFYIGKLYINVEGA